MSRIKRFLDSKGFTSAAASVLAVLVGLLFGFIIMLISNPRQAFEGIGIILAGGFGGGAKGIGQMLYYSVPYMMTGLSVGFAFKTGLFNIGASGQFTVGAFTAILVGVKCTFLPAPFHWIFALLCAALAGAIWALVPGVFKAFLNVNEVISAIMMNYIGLYFVNMLAKAPFLQGANPVYDSTRTLTSNVAGSAVLPKWFLADLFPNSTVNVGFFIAVGVAVLMYFVLNKTVFGYELRACGLNRDASRYAGINEKRSIVLSMVIAGALAGLGGGIVYLSGANGRRYKVQDAILGDGFQGITVALLGLSNPIGTVFAALFIAYITIGGEYMQKLDFAVELISIITALIIYFSAFALVFRNVVGGVLGRARLRIAKTDGDRAAKTAKGGDGK